MIWAQNLQGRLALRAGDHDAAGAHLAQCLRVFRSRENESGIAATLFHQGRLAQAQGHSGQAAALFSECLRLRPKPEVTLATLEHIASLAATQGDSERAARLFSATTALRTSVPYPAPCDEDVLALLSGVRNALVDPALQAAWEAGSGMTLEQAVAGALREG
jgi:tetratricopeptide (TPR) repeat protein